MKYSIKQRILAIVLTLTMIVPMLPVMSTHVHAAGTLTVTDANIGLSWTDASSTNGKASWTATVDTVTGTATGYTQYLISKKSVTTKLTITNNHSDDRTLSFDYSLTGGGSVSGIISGTSGSYSETLTAGASTTITLTSPTGSGNTNTLTLSNLQLLSAGNVTSTFLAPENGSYTVDGTAVTAQTTKEKAATEAYALKATPATDYMFFGWWSEASQSYVSYEAIASLKFSADPQLKPVFLHNTTALFGVGTQTFADLTEAANYASTATTKTVVLLNNGTVSGNHTIPSNVTLLIPYNSTNTKHGDKASCTSSTFNNVAWVNPTAYKTLTLAADAKITVNGAIEVGGQHAASNGGNMYCGAPTGPVGFINMVSGSNITLNNGANLYCWGYITGGGNVIADSGSKVYENFQFTDFRGGDDTSKLAQTYAEKYGVFPINQYYVQNIEVPLTLNAGATEYSATSIYSSAMAATSSIAFIGNTQDSMFKLVSGSVTKSYNGSSDRMSIEINGELSVSPIKMGIGGINLSSEQFELPVTNNMSIIVKSGSKISMAQDIALLPGAEIVVENGAECILNEGVNAYIYDADNWGTYCGAPPSGKKTLIPIAYAPGRGANVNRAQEALQDAKIVVNGNMDASNGFVYTTGGGAQIINDGPGIVYLNPEQPKNSVTYQNIYTKDNAEGGMQEIAVNSVWLKNGGVEGTTYTKTGEIDSDDNTYQYCSEHDQWYTDECEKCNAGFTVTWIVDGEPVEVDEDVTGFPEFDGTITVPEGKHFSGWDADDDGEVDISIGAPTADMTIVAIFENCYDNNNDHKCDRADCGKTLSQCADNDKNHKCDICDKVLSQCADNDKNHKCDECGETTSTCEDKTGDGDHKCDLCGEALSQCADKTGDGDHKCDECGNDNVSEHTGNAPVNENFKEATCTTAGKYDSVVYCSECNAEMSRTNVTVDPLEHDWNAPVYTWSEDGKTCTAERTCKHDGTHKETETVTASGVVTTPANCVEMGTTTYTADFDAEWAVDGQTTTRQDVAINDDHDYQITYTDDGVTHTINYVCSRNSSHTKSESGKSHNYGDDLVCDECGNEKIVSGDIDGNGIVELSDVTEFARYLAGWDISCNEAVLDVNGDGKVNLNDLVHLAQYVAGWENIVLH